MTCGSTMQGKQDPDHTHICGSDHETGDHLCVECRRYFMQKGNP